MPNHRMLSRPVRLNWAGWETDTHRLQRQGWALSVDQDVYRQRMRIMMRHEGIQMQAMTDEVCFDYYRNSMDFSYLDHIVVPVQALARSITINMHGEMNWASFKPVDAMPQFTMNRIGSMEDLVHFAPSLVRTEEIILPEDNIPELLERIRKMQEPARIERLKAELAADREGSMIGTQPRQKFHAQILSIAA